MAIVVMAEENALKPKRVMNLLKAGSQGLKKILREASSPVSFSDIATIAPFQVCAEVVAELQNIDPLVQGQRILQDVAKRFHYRGYTDLTGMCFSFLVRSFKRRDVVEIGFAASTREAWREPESPEMYFGLVINSRDDREGIFSEFDACCKRFKISGDERLFLLAALTGVSLVATLAQMERSYKPFPVAICLEIGLILCIHDHGQPFFERALELLDELELQPGKVEREVTATLPNKTANEGVFSIFTKTLTADNVKGVIWEWFSLLAQGHYAGAERLLRPRMTDDWDGARLKAQLEDYPKFRSVTEPPKMKPVGPRELGVNLWHPPIKGCLGFATHTVPIDGEWSDLTAVFEINLEDDGRAWSLSLQDMHY